MNHTTCVTKKNWNVKSIFENMKKNSPKIRNFLAFSFMDQQIFGAKKNSKRNLSNLMNSKTFFTICVQNKKRTFAI